jgi:hypothetical protein
VLGFSIFHVNAQKAEGYRIRTELTQALLKMETFKKETRHEPE